MVDWLVDNMTLAEKIRASPAQLSTQNIKNINSPVLTATRLCC